MLPEYNTDSIQKIFKDNLIHKIYDLLMTNQIIDQHELPIRIFQSKFSPFCVLLQDVIRKLSKVNIYIGYHFGI